MTWENVLQHYRSQYFQVYTQEQLAAPSTETFAKDSSPSPAVIAFLHQLAQPQNSLKEAFVKSLQVVHGEEQGASVFLPVSELLDDATLVAVLHGKHFAWKSPDAWSYLFEVPERDKQ